MANDYLLGRGITPIDWRLPEHAPLRENTGSVEQTQRQKLDS